jgi:hypothetical protein
MNEQRQNKARSPVLMLTRLQFSLASLLIGVFAVAFACAAMRSASDLWASAAFTACVFVLLFSILAVLFLRDSTRAFWTGFCLFGVAYLLLVFGPWFSGNVKDHLITSKLLGYTHKKLATVPSDNAGMGVAVGDLDEDGWVDLYVANDTQPNNLYRNVGNGKFVDVSESLAFGTQQADFDADGDLDLYVSNFGATSRRSWRNFERIGHSLFALLFGLVGGVLARHLWRTRTRVMN